MNYEKGTFCIVPNMGMIQHMSGYALKVYLALCKHADDNGICYPGRKRIQDTTGIKTKRTISKATQELCDLGVIEKYQRQREDGGYSSNTYQIKQVDTNFAPVGEQKQQGEVSKNAPRGCPKTTLGGVQKQPTNYTSELNQITKPDEHLEDPKTKALSYDEMVELVHGKFLKTESLVYKVLYAWFYYRLLCKDPTITHISTQKLLSTALFNSRNISDAKKVVEYIEAGIPQDEIAKHFSKSVKAWVAHETAGRDAGKPYTLAWLLNTLRV